jgi:DNA-binding phage protein
MMDIKHFYWLPTPSAWQEAEGWRARRQAMVQDTLDTSDAANSIFATAATDKIQGMAKLAAQAAINRIKKAAKAKMDKTLLQIDSTLGSVGQSSSTNKTSTATKVDKKV